MCAKSFLKNSNKVHCKSTQTTILNVKLRFVNVTRLGKLLSFCLSLLTDLLIPVVGTWMMRLWSMKILAHQYLMIKKKEMFLTIYFKQWRLKKYFTNTLLTTCPTSHISIESKSWAIIYFSTFWNANSQYIKTNSFDSCWGKHFFVLWQLSFLL